MYPLQTTEGINMSPSIDKDCSLDKGCSLDKDCTNPCITIGSNNRQQVVHHRPPSALLKEHGRFDNDVVSSIDAKRLILNVLTILLTLQSTVGSGVLLAQEPLRPAKKTTWYDRQSKWQGFAQYHFTVDGRKAYLVVPETAADGKPWIWRARFPNFHTGADIELVKRGFHIAYVDVAGMFGSPRAVQIGDQLYAFMTKQRGLAPKVVLEGVSRGGLFIYNWAAKNPDKVACIYADTPVCDFKSWPAGLGKGIGHQPSWQQCLKEYGLSEKDALNYRGNPVDRVRPIVDAKIPLLHIVSESDRVVPPAENTYVLKKRIEELGGSMAVISVPQGTEKSNGHHFEHPAVDQVVEFIWEHGRAQPPTHEQKR